jgi:beta-lactam-binding protein with PASTA domain
MFELLDKLQLRENTKRALWLNIILIIAISFIILLLFFYVYLPVTTHHGDTITVPDLSNMKVSELEEFLSDKELRFIVDDSNYVEGKAPLSVLAQDPVAGSKVKINRRIHLTINSTTPPLEKLPDVTDISMKQVVQMLQSAGFKIGTQKYVPDLAANVVTRISHKDKFYTHDELRKGVILPKGSVIDLEIGDGMGKDSFEIPNVVNKPIDEAEGILIGSGLVVNRNYDNTATQATGIVIRQKPEYVEGKMVKTGTVIDIWIAGEKE